MVNPGFTSERTDSLASGAAFLQSPRAVWWGGFLVISGGVMFVVAAFVSFAFMIGWLAPITPGYEMFADEYAAKRLLNMSFALTAPLGALLVATGMLGVCALLAMESESRLGLAKFGAFLAAASSVCASAFTVYEFMPRYFERDIAEFTASQTAYVASFLGWICGLSLVGFAASRARSARSLGGWRLSLAPLAILCLPARHAALLFLTYPTGFFMLMEPGFALAALLEAPRAVGGVGWIFFGVALSKARDKELETTRKENLALARCFYEEAWGKGNLELVDDILAPDFVDRRHNAEGAESFKHYLTDLRKTFPDFALDIHAQTADGDEIATRLELHGTDRGGVLYFPPTNKKASFAGTFTDTIHEGRITEHRGEIDEEALFRQLGHEKPRTATRFAP